MAEEELQEACLIDYTIARLVQFQYLWKKRNIDIYNVV